MTNAPADQTIPDNPGWYFRADPRKLQMRPLLFTAPRASELPASVIHPFRAPHLNQGNTGTCTEHGLRHFCIGAPMETPDALLAPRFTYYDWAVANDAYRENDAAVDPGRTFGTTTDDIMKAARAFGIVSGWVYARNMDELLQWYATKGGVMLGVDWSPDFGYPDAEGFITSAPSGYNSGHFFYTSGYDRTGTKHSRHYVEAHNSWGDWWGDGGVFRIELDFLAHLCFERHGDVVAAIQIGPLPPPPPPEPEPTPAEPVAPVHDYQYQGIVDTAHQYRERFTWDLWSGPPPGPGPRVEHSPFVWDAARGAWISEKAVYKHW